MYVDPVENSKYVSIKFKEFRMTFDLLDIRNYADSMRQTIKDYDNETQYSSNAIIIGAHCPSEDRTQRCIGPITRLKISFQTTLILYVLI